MPRLSPAAPSSVNKTMAKAFRRRSLSRRCGSAMRRTLRPMPKRRVLRVAKARLDCPAFGVIIYDLARRRLGAAGGQTPSFFHVLGLDTDDRPTLVPARRDLGLAELARSSALADPRGGGARLTIGRGDMDVAAEPYDIRETQRVEKAEQLGVAETTIGQDCHHDALGQHLRQSSKAEVLEVVALVFEFILQDSQPQQWRRPAVVGDEV